jgi:NAD(P)H-dependent FMN reductase
MDVRQNKHIVALCGSQRDGSYTRQALNRTLTAAKQHGATTDLVEPAMLELPVFDPDSPDSGDAPELRQRIRQADAIVLGSPMYHGSYSSVLKTALDYCGFDEFDETTVGLLVVSGGGFTTPALEHLRSVARALNAWVLPHQVAIPNVETAFEDGQQLDAEIAERIETLGTELVEYAGVASFPEATATSAVPTAD